MRAFVLALVAFLAPVAVQAQVQPDPNTPAGKLPPDVTPSAYRLDLTVIPDQPRFTGHAEIDAVLNHPAASIYMHGRELKIARATATVNGQTFPVSFTQVNDLGGARVDFGRTVPAGKVTLKFDYDAAFGSDPSGLYHIKVGDDWYSWTQFESIDARSAFPGFDEPGYKTPFTVSLTTKKGFVVASNAPEIGAAPGANGLIKHRFAATKPLPTYLVAFVVGPFAMAQTVVPPTPQRKTPLPLRVIATKPNADKLKFALTESGKIVALLEKYFGQPFPFPKLDQIASPVMPGAMENAGADIYGDDILMLSPDATGREKGEFGMVVAHELSHQWFGDLVTPAWWDDIWLNESFANWMGYRIGNEWRPDLKINANAIDEALGSMDTDALKVGRPIHQHITRDNQIDAAFDGITYGKGGQVIAMVAAYLGDAKFRAGVRLHVSRHPYGNASTDDFFGALADAAKDPRVLAAMRGFIDQQGVPLVTITHQGGQLVASQSPYSYFGSAPGSQQWSVPLCVRQGSVKSCTLLDKPSMAITAAGSGAIMPNADGKGYYRFDLDRADWDALIATAATLPPGEALATDDSLWASFYAGKAPFAELIGAARAMAANPYAGAALDGGNRFTGMMERGLIPSEAVPGFRKLIGDLYRPMFDRLGLDLSAGAYAKADPDEQRMRRSLAAGLAHQARDPELRAKLVAAGEAYLAGDKKALDPSYLGLAMAIAVEENDLAFAKSLTDKALGGNDSALRRAAIAAVAAAGKPEFADWLLRDFSDKRVRGVERLTIVGNLIQRPETRDAAIDYLVANYQQFTASNGIFVASRLPSMVEDLCSLDQADRVEATLGPAVAKQGVGKLALDRAIETIRNCARLKAARADEIRATLAEVH